MRHTSVCLAVAFLAACGGGSPPPPAKTPEPVTAKSGGPAPAPVPAGPVGKITGTVKVEGKHRRPKHSIDQACAALHPDGLLTEDTVIDEPSGGLRWAFLHLSEGVTGSFPAPSAPAVLDQKGCQYEPHVLGIVAGQPIQLKNSDGFLHNVHAVPMNNEEFNFAQQPGQQDSRTFKKKETMVFVKCDIHAWMGAWVGVLDHPFFAVTDAAGKFTIPNVPPGKYTLSVWHEKFAGEPVKIEVKPEAAAEASFTLKKR